MKKAAQQRGKRLAVRIHKSFTEEAKMEKGRLVMASLPARDLSLNEVLANVTSENIHSETFWGPLVAKEIY